MNTTDGSLKGGSLSHAQTQSSFDMRKESDVIAVLKLIHQNPIDSVIKNHLRDLIFAYKKSMLDDDLEKVRQGFIPFGIVIESTTAKKETAAEVSPSSKPYLGNSRPQPRFAGVSAQAEVKKIPVTPVKESPAPAAVEAQAPVAKTAVAPQEAPQAQQPAPIAEAVQKPAAVLSEAELANSAERIKEIKRIVNEKVGNPVNLIESHNEIGREYMGALLDAMKKSNGGAPEELSAAMVRLEKAFAAVHSVIGNASVSQVSSANTAPAVQPQATSAPQASAPQNPPAQAAQAQQASPISAPQTPSAPPVPPAVSSTPVAPAAPLASVPPAFAPSTTHAESTVPVTPVTPATPVPPPPAAEKEPTAQQQAPASVPKMSSVRDQLAQQGAPVTPRAPETVATAPGIPSVAKEKELQDLLRANREKEVLTEQQQEEARIAAMDPLLAPDVTSGLSQLLTEWALFKSSGIFGTGPSGKDHPLYLKLAPLTMAAVIAGRFDGSTPQIKQSITDYMNGWRYEEGVTHEHGETFEHYLRRVVRHILNKKRK